MIDQELKAKIVELAEAIIDAQPVIISDYIYECPFCKAIDTLNEDESLTHLPECIVHEAQKIVDTWKS